MFVTLSTYLTMHVFMMLLNKMCCIDDNELGWNPGWLNEDVK